MVVAELNLVRIAVFKPEADHDADPERELQGERPDPAADPVSSDPYFVRPHPRLRQRLGDCRV